MKSFSLKVTACNKVFFDGECKMVILPAADGEMGIMADHEHMTATVEEGIMRIRLDDGDEWQKVFVSQGLAEIGDNSVNIIVFFAEKPEDVEEMRARAEIDQAREELMQKHSIQEYEQSKAQMARAFAKLKRSNRDSSLGE